MPPGDVVLIEEEEGEMPDLTTRDVRLSSGHIVSNVPGSCSLIVKTALSRFGRDRAIVKALKKAMSFKKNQSTNHACHLLRAFASSHPQMAAMHQEQIMALARMSLLLEVKGVCECDCSSVDTDFRWLALSKVASS